MARHEMPEIGGMHAEGASPAESFYQLGMRYAVGDAVPTDLVSAHKWFNLAAMQGNRDAIRLRREIAEQMSEDEIAEAQRAARDFIRAH